MNEEPAVDPVSMISLSLSLSLYNARIGVELWLPLLFVCSSQFSFFLFFLLHRWYVSFFGGDRISSSFFRAV